MKELPFFVYGSLRRGMKNYYGYLVGLTRLELPAKLYGADLYTIYGVDFPAMVKGSSTVVGELMYPFSDLYLYVMRSLDKLEGNGVLYNREEVTVKLDDGSEEQAWAYFWIGPRNLLEWRIEHGDWKRFMGGGE